MLNGDTVKLLRECNAGTKMAVYFMDEICDKISDADFKNVIMASKEKHERLGNEIHAQLEKCACKGNVLAENKCQVSS